MTELKPWNSNNIRIYSNSNRRYQGISECWCGTHVVFKDIGFFTLVKNQFYNFEVNPEYRNRGYARKLFRQAKRLGKFYGYDHLLFSSKPELTPMYESFGAFVTDRSKESIKYRVNI